MSRARCLVRDLYCTYLTLCRRIGAYHSIDVTVFTYGMIILGGNFDAGICLRIGLNFFWVVDVCTCAHEVQRRTPTEISLLRASGLLYLGHGSPNRGPRLHLFVIYTVYHRYFYVMYAV